MTGKKGSLRRACVIGWPAAHSRSPLIHNFWLNQLEIEGSYEQAAVPPDEFEDFIREFAARGWVGGNVTLPHKQAAFALCDHVSLTASRLKAVNTLWLQEGLLCGDNTDVQGFLGALDEDAPGWDKRTRKALVLGAGGAARAIIHALELREIEQLIIANRTRARAEEVAAGASQPVEVRDWAELGAALGGVGLLVNTTSLGMKGQPGLGIDLAEIPKTAVVSDIVYVPLETELIRQAKNRDLATVGGLGMLLHQAVPGFERWFGAKPSVTPELRRLVEADILAAS